MNQTGHEPTVLNYPGSVPWCNRFATEGIDTERHETSRTAIQNGLGPNQTTRTDTERHESTRAVVDMESNKELK